MAATSDLPKTTAIADLKVRLINLQKEHDEANEGYDQYEEQYHSMITKIRHRKNICDAHDAMMQMIKDHQALNESLTDKCLPYEVPTMEGYREALGTKLGHLINEKDHFEKDLKQYRAGLKQLEKEINHLKPRLQEFEKEKNEIVSRLLQLGVPDEEISILVGRFNKYPDSPTGDFISPAVGHSRSSDLNYVTIAQPSNIVLDHSLWYEDCSREKAVEYLMERSDGTFLIRPSKASPSTPFALSVVMNGKVYHCKIFEQSGLFGFSNIELKYRELSDLVAHYQRNSLEIHNEILKTRLTTPFKLPKN